MASVNKVGDLEIGIKAQFGDVFKKLDDISKKLEKTPDPFEKMNKSLDKLAKNSVLHRTLEIAKTNMETINKSIEGTNESLERIRGVGSFVKQTQMTAGQAQGFLRMFELEGMNEEFVSGMLARLQAKSELPENKNLFDKYSLLNKDGSKTSSFDMLNRFITLYTSNKTSSSEASSMIQQLLGINFESQAKNLRSYDQKKLIDFYNEGYKKGISSEDIEKGMEIRSKLVNQEKNLLNERDSKLIETRGVGDALLLNQKYDLERETGITNNAVNGLVNHPNAVLNAKEIINYQESSALKDVFAIAYDRAQLNNIGGGFLGHTMAGGIDYMNGGGGFTGGGNIVLGEMIQALGENTKESQRQNNTSSKNPPIAY